MHTYVLHIGLHLGSSYLNLYEHRKPYLPTYLQNAKQCKKCYLQIGCGISALFFNFLLIVKDFLTPYFLIIERWNILYSRQERRDGENEYPPIYLKIDLKTSLKEGDWRFKDDPNRERPFLVFQSFHFHWNVSEVRQITTKVYEGT